MRSARAQAVRGWVVCAALVMGAAAWSFSLGSFWHAKELVFALALPVLALCRFLEEGPLRLSPVQLRLAAILAIVSLLGLGVAGSRAMLAEATLRGTVWLAFALLSSDLIWSRVWRRRILGSLVLSANLVALLALLQWFHVAQGLFPVFAHYDQRMYSVFGNQDFLGGYLALGLTLIVGAAIRGQTPVRRWAPQLVLTALVLILSGARSAWIAAALGLFVVLLSSPPPARKRAARMLPVLLACVAGAAALNGPGLLERVQRPLQGGDTGVAARAWFWDATVSMFAEHPVLGVGLGQYRLWSNLHAGQVYTERQENGFEHYHNELLIEHAHMDPLEWAAETGGAGVLLLAWALRPLRNRRGFALAPLAALTAFSCFNAGFHCAPFSIAALLFIALLDPPRPLSASNAALPGLSSLFGACLLLVLHVAMLTVPSALLRAAQDRHLTGQEPLEAYARATRWCWTTAETHFYEGLALHQEARYAEAQAALDRAATGMGTGEYHLVRARNLQQLGRTQESADAWCAVHARWPWHDEARANCLARHLGDE